MPPSEFWICGQRSLPKGNEDLIKPLRTSFTPRYVQSNERDTREWIQIDEPGFEISAPSRLQWTTRARRQGGVGAMHRRSNQRRRGDSRGRPGSTELEAMGHRNLEERSWGRSEAGTTVGGSGSETDGDTAGELLAEFVIGGQAVRSGTAAKLDVEPHGPVGGHVEQDIQVLGEHQL